MAALFNWSRIILTVKRDLHVTTAKAQIKRSEVIQQMMAPQHWLFTNNALRMGTRQALLPFAAGFSVLSALTLGTPAFSNIRCVVPATLPSARRVFRTCQSSMKTIPAAMLVFSVQRVESNYIRKLWSVGQKQGTSARAGQEQKQTRQTQTGTDNTGKTQGEEDGQDKMDVDGHRRLTSFPPRSRTKDTNPRAPSAFSSDSAVDGCSFL